MYLDRDFLRTPEGFFFCVVGSVHPRGRIIAYLKYVPSEKGKWGRGDGRYFRTMQVYSMPALLGNIENLRSSFPQYVFRSRVMGIQMSAVPRRCIASHYRPSVKLKELLMSSSKDELEDKAVRFILRLSETSGVPSESFGVTGSILLGIHNPRFSDLDIIVYGHDNAVSVKKALLRLFTDEKSSIKPFHGRTLEEALHRWTQRYPITPRQARWFATRKWNRGVSMGKEFSILPVKLPHEVRERYGDIHYRSEGIAEGSAEIADTQDSHFLPSIYTVKNVELSPASAQVQDLVSYDSFYSGIFEKGDHVSFRGKIEMAIFRKDEESHRRIIIGSSEANGADYIRPLLSRKR